MKLKKFCVSFYIVKKIANYLHIGLLVLVIILMNLTMFTPSHRNDYLYDENGQVYEFIWYNNTKYFYAKDFRISRHKW